MSLLTQCKLLLRQQNTTAFDTEIQALIDACISDLLLSGVVYKDDPLLNRAITIYVKAHFGSENPDRQGLIDCYNSLKIHLTISKKYGEELENEKGH